MKLIVGKKNNSDIKINPVTGRIEVFKEGGFSPISEEIPISKYKYQVASVGQFEAIEMSHERLSEFLLQLNEESLQYKSSVIKENGKYYIL